MVFFFRCLMPSAYLDLGNVYSGLLPIFFWVVGFVFSFLVSLVELFYLEAQTALGLGMHISFLHVVHGSCENGDILKSRDANTWTLSLKRSQATPSFFFHAILFSSFYAPRVKMGPKAMLGMCRPLC